MAIFLQNNTLGMEEDQALMKQRKLLQKKADISGAQSETTIIKKVCMVIFFSRICLSVNSGQPYCPYRIEYSKFSYQRSSSLSFFMVQSMHLVTLIVVVFLRVFVFQLNFILSYGKIIISRFTPQSQICKRPGPLIVESPKTIGWSG